MNAAMDTNRSFLNDLEQPTRQDPATDAYYTPDVAVVHAAFRDRYNWEQLDTM